MLLTVCRCLCELEAYDTKTNSLYVQTHLTTKALSDSELLNKLIKMYTKSIKTIALILLVIEKQIL